MLMSMRVLGISLVFALFCASSALAQGKPSVHEEAYGSPTIVLVMESAGGLRAAAALRKSLNLAGCSVVSLVEAKLRALTPNVMLTIAADNSRVQVVYWDSAGQPDALSAAGPATADQLFAVVLALSSALIDRHRHDGATIAHEVSARARMFEDQSATRAIYAMLGRERLAPRTNVYLRFEDF
jgi:hypothetical protein